MFVVVPIRAVLRDEQEEGVDELLQRIIRDNKEDESSFDSVAAINVAEIEHMIKGQEGNTTIYLCSGVVLVTDMLIDDILSKIQ